MEVKRTMPVDLQEETQIQIGFKETPYTVKTIEWQGREFKEAVKLRYKIFCKELGWLPRNSKETETDQYDRHAIHFGITNQLNSLVGYARVVLSEPLGFLLENEMNALLPSNGIPVSKKKTIEISRFAVNSDFQGNIRRKYKLSSNLYKAIYHWTKLADKRFWLVEVEQKHLRLLQLQGFDFHQIGQAVEFQKGITTVAAIMDIRDTEKKVFQKKPDLFFWFQEGLPLEKQVSSPKGL